MKRVILLALAVTLAVAVIASVLIVRSQAGTAKTTPGWTTYRDPLGLYTICYPTGWKANDTEKSNDWLTSIAPITRDGGGAEKYLEASGDVLSMSYSANRYEAIQIRAIEWKSTL